MRKENKNQLRNCNSFNSKTEKNPNLQQSRYCVRCKWRRCSQLYELSTQNRIENNKKKNCYTIYNNAYKIEDVAFTAIRPAVSNPLEACFYCAKCSRCVCVCMRVSNVYGCVCVVRVLFIFIAFFICVV